ncbi:MAG: AI-2E family transporter [Gammaproteobacteria bacterium]|nr:AI-2E family transporter [Gammaproteobacteria bacterium]
MEPRTSSPVSGETFYARTFALLTLLFLGYLLYQILLPFFAPLSWALFIAFLLQPVHIGLTNKLKSRQNLSAAFLTFAVFLMVVGPLTALGAAFGAQAAELLQFVQRMATDHRSAELSDLNTIPVIGTVLTWLQDSVGVSPAQIQSGFVEGARTVLQVIGSLGRKIFFGALGTVMGFAVMMFILFFMIRDSQPMLMTLRALVPMSPAYKTRLFSHLAAVARAVVYGSGVTALVQGTLVGIGFAIVGLPSPIVFGVFAALFALVPMAGTPIVWVPAVIVLAVQQRWVSAIFLLAWGIMVTTIDNFIRPLLVSGRAQVGTLTVFIGVLGGVSAFGTVGLFMGPLVLALVIALIQFTIDVRQARVS